jgi:hypothetical protein
MRTETKYNKVVNFDPETNEILVLDYIFDHGDGFKGATGSRFEPVSKSEYDNRVNDEDSIIDQIIDCGIPTGYERNGAQGVYDAMVANDGIRDFLFDCSYADLWDYLREELNLSEEEAYIFNCSGGGRCFEHDFIGNVNIHLSELIRKAETK